MAARTRPVLKPPAPEKPNPTAADRLMMIRQLLRMDNYIDEVALFYIGRVALNEGTVERGKFVPNENYNSPNPPFPLLVEEGEYKANNLTISTTYHGASVFPKTRWTAIDSETYDGAPDSKPPYNCIGYGDTEAEAIVDLMSEIFAAFSLI